MIEGICLIDRSCDKGDVPDRDAAVQRIRYGNDGTLSHAERQYIRLRIQQHRAFQRIVPVIIVRHAPQACLDAADDNGLFRISAADQIAVNNGCMIGPLSHHAAGRIEISGAPFFGDAVMIHHRIHIACAHQKAQSWFTEYVDAVFIFPVRLGDDTHTIACVFQHTADDCRTERRMIDIGISDHKRKVHLIPSAPLHILF